MPASSQWTLGPEQVVAHVSTVWHDKCSDREVRASVIQVHASVRSRSQSIATTASVEARPRGSAQASGARLILRVYADVGGIEAVVGIAEVEAAHLRQDMALPPIIVTDSLASSVRVTAQLWMQDWSAQLYAEVRGAVALGDPR